MKINVMQQFFVFLGVIGAIVCFCGVIHPTSNGVSAIGAALLLATSIFYRLNYFIALEVIVLASHGAVFFGLGPVGILSVKRPIKRDQGNWYNRNCLASSWSIL